MKFGKILITGGAGFLGSQLVKEMIPVAEHIYIIDDLSTGNKSSIPNATNISFFHASITDEETLEHVLPEVEYVFHLACKNLVLSYNNIQDDFETNLYGGLLLLQKTEQLSRNLKRFVYTSTASVYGDATILPTPETYHNTKLPYSASKFSTEHYCHVFHYMYKLPVTILRLSNVYGPGQLISNPYCGVVAKFFEAAMHNQSMHVFGDGTQTRDFTYIEDALNAILLVATNDQSIGHVYNVSTEKETSVLDLATEINKVCGNQELKLSFLPKRSVDVVQRRCLDHSNLKKLGWECHHSLILGLTKTYQWLTRGESS
ncbi:NAD-dependent epimerase/dehydratase family protein [Metabacillus niabensis]|uniref:UDP-glucose 4-epimerase n=1 Tax=Metabacillus niabensis TaxID=324854 RepID=A0ABT9Z6U6_9BACI|nr:NAD-dependent epimerase/dehydratase family protein [Metabacillus niabensis]MDQ0227982.1 UDP-glucose 4-epimerase [Metabacillus niabensis]